MDRWGVLAATLTMAACARGLPPRDDTASRAAAPGGGETARAKPADAEVDVAPAPVPREARLVDRVGDTVLSIPIARGSVRGIATWVLVDTGASSHVVAAWLARRAELATRAAGPDGADHAGRPVATRIALSPQLALEGIGTVEDGAVLIAEVPELLERLAIGAVVSPQLLAREGEHVELDLDGGALRVRFGPAETEPRPGFRSLASAIARGHTCTARGTTPEGLAFVLDASIEGHRAALLLDTGSARTDLLSRSRAARALSSRTRPSSGARYAASGRVDSKSVPRAAIVVAGARRVVEIDVVDGEGDRSCPRDGALGMDVLAPCVLRFRGDEASAMCRDDAERDRTVTPSRAASDDRRPRGR